MGGFAPAHFYLKRCGGLGDTWSGRPWA